MGLSSNEHAARQADRLPETAECRKFASCPGTLLLLFSVCAEQVTQGNLVDTACYEPNRYANAESWIQLTPCITCTWNCFRWVVPVKGSASQSVGLLSGIELQTCHTIPMKARHRIIFRYLTAAKPPLKIPHCHWQNCKKRLTRQSGKRNNQKPACAK